MTHYTDFINPLVGCAMQFAKHCCRERKRRLVFLYLSFFPYQSYVLAENKSEGRLKTMGTGIRVVKVTEREKWGRKVRSYCPWARCECPRRRSYERELERISQLQHLAQYLILFDIMTKYLLN